MDRFDGHKPPLSTERSDLYWGTHLTETERWLEDLDEGPRRAFDSSSRAAIPRRASLSGAPGADPEENVAPSPMAPGGTSCPAVGPNPVEPS